MIKGLHLSSAFSLDLTNGRMQCGERESGGQGMLIQNRLPSIAKLLKHSLATVELDQNGHFCHLSVQPCGV